MNSSAAGILISQHYVFKNSETRSPERSLLKHGTKLAKAWMRFSLVDVTYAKGPLFTI